MPNQVKGVSPEQIYVENTLTGFLRAEPLSRGRERERFQERENNGLRTLSGLPSPNKDICKELLERLLKIKIERLEYPEIEKTISPYYDSKGIRLDVYVKDSDKVFDIELQNSPDLLGLRTRYYQSMVDADNLIKGEHFSELPQSFIIFICTQDPFNNDLPIYTFRNHCDENLVLVLDDFAVKKFFNANAYAKENDIEIKSFLEYIYNNKPVDDFTDRIESFVHKIKQQEVNRKEYSTVNIHDQDTFRRGKLEGIQQGELQAKIETAKNMIKDNIDLCIIQKYTGLPKETVEQLAKNNT